jgi:hypothetical protein
MTEAVRYSESVTIRCQPEITALVDHAARAKGQKPSEWTRQALMAALRAAGLDPASHLAPERKTNPATAQSQQTASEI